MQRTAELRIASAYRTVSSPAVLVIVDTIAADLLAAEQIEIYKAKSAVNHFTGKIRFQNGNDNGTMKIEEGGQRDLFRI